MELPATVTLEFPLFCSKSAEKSERAGHRSRVNSGQSPVVSFAMRFFDLLSRATTGKRIAKSEKRKAELLNSTALPVAAPCQRFRGPPARRRPRAPTGDTCPNLARPRGIGRDPAAPARAPATIRANRAELPAAGPAPPAPCAHPAASDKSVSGCSTCGSIFRDA